MLTPGCVRCGEADIESAIHLFVKCLVATQVWQTLSAKLNMPLINPHETIRQTYLTSVPQGPRARDDSWLTCIFHIYSIDVVEREK
jgi:hypothetical protein